MKNVEWTRPLDLKSNLTLKQKKFVLNWSVQMSSNSHIVYP